MASKKGSAYWFILPALIVYVVLTLLPSFYTLVYSLTNYDGILKLSQLRFVGLDNYIYLLTQDKQMGQAILNTLVWLVFQLLLGNGLAFLFALLLNQKIRGTNLFRAVIFLPVVISSVAVSFVWGYILDPQVGDLNKFLQAAGLGEWTRNWLGDSSTALISIILVDIWKSVGFNMVILLAGLQTIPSDVYEAGKIDGAGPWRAFTRITFPLMIPVLGMVTILTVNGTLRTFDMVYILTGGGPGYATEVLMTRIFSEAFTANRMGYASSLAVLLFVVLFFLAYAQLKMTEQKDTN
ncbi:carbohydrate ABC transporter permease [Cohnella sp.]|uniref:carbohydrate ABC transporter permease n=1 Tax=Cohnella sp. TaxID=1883426 RepID=UPI0037046FD5